MSAVAPTAGSSTPQHHSWVRSTWPVDRGQALRLGVALLATIGIFTALGLVMTDLLAPNPITRADDEIARWFVERRTPLLNDVSTWAALLADTMTKIALTAVFACFALAVWRRWHEAVYVVTTLVFEATVFIVVTMIVTRPRPDVPRLEDSPVNSSFPSGHVAAATVYGAFVVVVFWHTRSRVWRSLAVALALMVVTAVAWARMYQGMHFASDVATGVVLGLTSLAVCYHVLGAPPDSVREENDPVRQPERAMSSSLRAPSSMPSGAAADGDAPG